jgi:galactose mutarotase-like enzyme
MFSITRDVGPFQTCELLDTEGGSRARVAPGRGGLLTHFGVQGREILYLDETTFQDPTRSVRGGIPILFPICGNLPGDTYTLDSVAYTLKQHGLARQLPWRIADASTADGAVLVLELTSDEDTLRAYPFAFALRFVYRLDGHRLTLRQEYCNRSAAPMPMYAGFHPYFVASDKSALAFEIPASRYTDQVSGEAGRFSAFPFERPTIDWIFTDVHARRAAVSNPKDGYRLVLECDPIFKYLVFWALAGKDFFCLEPWMAPRNALNTGDGLEWVAPGDCLRAEISLVAEVL